MDPRLPRQASAVLATLAAALHTAFAAAGGIAPTPALAWLLAAGTVLGAVLWWRAANTGPWLLAWLGMALLALPAALAWPGIGVSPGGLAALALLAAAFLSLVAGSLPFRPPALSEARP